MNRTVLFTFEQSRGVNYQTMVSLAENLVKFTLDNNLGCRFHYDWYNEKLIKTLNPHFYFTVTDNFFEFSYDYLSVIDGNIFSIENKESLCKTYSLFDKIYKILTSFGIEGIRLIISYNEENPEKFVIEHKGDSLYLDILYHHAVKIKNLGKIPNIIIS